MEIPEGKISQLCLECYSSIFLDPGQKEVLCSSCGTVWEIGWLHHNLPLTMRPVNKGDKRTKNPFFIPIAEVIVIPKILKLTNIISPL